MSTSTTYVQATLTFQRNLYESRVPARRWLHETRLAWVTERLMRHATSKTIFLDVGVGCGMYTRLMAPQCGQVVAIDVNPDFVAAASWVEGVSAVRADVCEPGMGMSMGGFADLAVCSEVIEHVPDPHSALVNIYEALAPGGVLVLTTPQKWSTTELVGRLLDIAPVRWLARQVYREPVDALGHISRLTAGELQQALADTGFEVREAFRFGMYLPVLAEFGGNGGLRVLRALERIAQRSRIMGWMLWTQAYVCVKPLQVPPPRELR